MFGEIEDALKLPGASKWATTNEVSMTKLIELLRSLERERFYGNVAIEFKAGDITLVRKEQTIKLDNMRNNPNELPAK